jgi:hypothetical protein
VKGIFFMAKLKWLSKIKKGTLFILVLNLWLSGCSMGSASMDFPSPDGQKRSSPIPVNSPVGSPYPTAKEVGEEGPFRTPVLPSNKNPSVQPAKDFTPPPPEQLALADLAIRLGLPSGEINILSSGPWTTTPPICNLALNEKQKLLFSGSHMQVILSYKDRSYEYWVFQIGDAQFALPCQ